MSIIINPGTEIGPPDPPAKGTVQWTPGLVTAVAHALDYDDRSDCPHFVNGGEGMGCGGCVTEPACITMQPSDGWPSQRVRALYPDLLPCHPDDGEPSDGKTVDAVVALEAITAEGWRLVPPEQEEGDES